MKRERLIRRHDRNYFHGYVVATSEELNAGASIFRIRGGTFVRNLREEPP
jgi:hypothetical protein